ncbi:stalk domain-containing protein [Paenibacillus daejeonensis]|uniref:stalk domain-containing protein n=1 Tax=Paenibacillus daejeonensis TaxID=135193 RepID=UPI00037B4F22|nr:stalk domain-containing protein [Paenibacillus daejeonensis]
MKSFKWLLVMSMLAIPLSGAPAPATAEGTGGNQLQLKKNSKIMIHNGTEVEAAQPIIFKDGASFAPLTGFAKVFGFQTSYIAETKESIASNGDIEYRFVPGSAIIKVNGEEVNSSGPVHILNGSLMVPIRTWSELSGATLSLVGGDMVLKWAQEASAEFEVQPGRIYAGETSVTYIDKAVHPEGLDFVDELWEGREDIFMQPGQYTITRSLMDEAGVWTEPYSVTIQVELPNQPPVADFTTDKTQYRIGEKIVYTDMSTDDNDDIVDTKWTNQKHAFFEDGNHPVTLEVTDGEGLKHSVTKNITVTTEVLYTKEEFGRIYTQPGDLYETTGSAVLDYRSIDFTPVDQPAQMIRSNSPETLTEPGIVYDDQVRGDTRFLIYNDNAAERNFKIYVLATNNNASRVDIDITAYGKGGPHQYSTNAGKMSTLRYLNSYADPSKYDSMSLAPGETKVVLPEMSEIAIKPKQVFSSYFDVSHTANVRYRVVVVEEKDNPIQTLSSLRNLPVDNKHTRGTFQAADRVIELNKLMGTEDSRLVIGDGKIDKYLYGIDAMSGDLMLNIGNFGVIYKLVLPRVAPNTMIALNARGGHYTGGFLVNGEMVEVTKYSILKDSNQVGVLHRTGNTEERVEILFTLASGSNLPINMLFLPIPAERQ